jgi:PilZ domain
MDEKRQRTRTRMWKDAMLISEHDSEGRYCVVSDITNGGARLHLTHTTRLPSTFSLTFDNFRSERVCRLIWRTVDTVGVRFVNR